MSAEKDLFSYLESTMKDVAVPKLPSEQLEYVIETAMDPIIGGKMIQYYAESQSPDAHEQIIRKYNDKLNYHFMAAYYNSYVNVEVEGAYGSYDEARHTDMAHFLVELQSQGRAHASGKMDYFEHHWYTDETTGIRRPILSLRLAGGSFVRENDKGGQLVGIPNYTTIPITSVAKHEIEYRIKD